MIGPHSQCMILSPTGQAQRLAAAEALQQRLPRLIFAALDTFPLADGREAWQDVNRSV